MGQSCQDKETIQSYIEAKTYPSNDGKKPTCEINPNGTVTHVVDLRILSIFPLTVDLTGEILNKVDSQVEFIPVSSNDTQHKWHNTIIVNSPSMGKLGSTRTYNRVRIKPVSNSANGEEIIQTHVKAVNTHLNTSRTLRALEFNLKIK